MNGQKLNNYKRQILDILDDHPFGLSITEIAEKSEFHRNTVSKYMNILEAEKKVNKKRIGTASIYTTKKRKYLRRGLVVSFIQSLLKGLKHKFPNNEQKLKAIGREITKSFQFPIGNVYFDEFKKVRSSSDTLEKLKLFELFYNSFDFFQDDLEIEIIELNSHKVIYRIKNSDFLIENGAFNYFFYIMCGITEGIYLQNLELEVICDVVQFKLPDSKTEAFIDISLEIR
jgi:DNA-binding transcriptional regulator YhcF (GntR family)